MVSPTHHAGRPIRIADAATLPMPGARSGVCRGGLVPHCGVIVVGIRCPCFGVEANDLSLAGWSVRHELTTPSMTGRVIDPAAADGYARRRCVQ